MVSLSYGGQAPAGVGEYEIVANSAITIMERKRIFVSLRISRGLLCLSARRSFCFNRMMALIDGVIKRQTPRETASPAMTQIASGGATSRVAPGLLMNSSQACTERSWQEEASPTGFEPVLAKTLSR